MIESVVHELLEGGTSAVDSVVSKLPKNFPDQIASSIEAGIKGRLRLLAASETPSSQKSWHRDPRFLPVTGRTCRDCY